MRCLSRIALPIAFEFTKQVRVAICETLVRKMISLIGRSICYLLQTLVIFSLEAAGRIRFYDMIFGTPPRASLSSQSLRALMVPQEWHLAMMVSSTSLVAIQSKFFVTGGPTAERAASLSSMT